MPTPAGSPRWKVAFRVDASPRIGTGHLARCLTLAGALAADGAAVAFAIRSPDARAADWIRTRGHLLLSLPAPAGPMPADAGEYARWLGVPWEEDARETLAALRGFRPDLLIADHYALDARWETEVRAAAKTLAVIDDIADRPHASDLLLDQNLHGDAPARYRGLVPDGCRLLLGPRYALLRPEFAAARAVLPPRDGALDRILFCFGGADPTGESVKALEGLALAGPRGRAATVVAGAYNPHFETLEAMARGRPGWDLRRHADDMAGLMAASGLAVGAGGSITWERCCLGLPAVVAVLSDNQEDLARAAAAAGVQRVLGRSRDLAPGDYARAIAALEAEDLRSMAKAGMELVDGLGCGRVAAALKG